MNVVVLPSKNGKSVAVQEAGLNRECEVQKRPKAAQMHYGNSGQAELTPKF